MVDLRTDYETGDTISPEDMNLISDAANDALAARPLISTLSASATLQAVPGCEFITILTSGALPVLPTAVGNTSVYTFKNTTGSGITIATTGGQNIDGSSLVVAAGAAARLVSDNANWRKL